MKGMKPTIFKNILNIKRKKPSITFDVWIVKRFLSKNATTEPLKSYLPMIRFSFSFVKLIPKNNFIIYLILSSTVGFLTLWTGGISIWLFVTPGQTDSELLGYIFDGFLSYKNLKVNDNCL